MKCVILIIECWHSRGTWTHGALRQVIKEFFRGFTITFPFTVKRYTPDMRGHHILALLSFLVGKTYFLYGMPRNYSEFMYLFLFGYADIVFVKQTKRNPQKNKQ